MSNENPRASSQHDELLCYAYGAVTKTNRKPLLASSAKVRCKVLDMPNPRHLGRSHCGGSALLPDKPLKNQQQLLLRQEEALKWSKRMGPPPMMMSAGCLAPELAPRKLLLVEEPMLVKLALMTMGTGCQAPASPH